MPINPDEPVTLKKHAYVKQVLYHPREYQPGELPAELLSDEYVVQNPSAVPTFDPFADRFEQTTLTIGTESPQSESGAFKNSTFVVAEKFQINSASVETIAGLDGVSLTVAKKVVAERAENQFTSLDDLKARVQSKGLDWDKYADRLLFDAAING